MDCFEFINGYENLYKINRNGEIYSCHYGKVMKPQLNKDGYLWVKLTKGGQCFKGFIHRLLGLQYIPNPDGLPQIDHIDRNKLNNSLENLRWVTQKENLKNKVRKGCVYLDKRKDGKVYWKASYSWYDEEGNKKIKQKTSLVKEVCDEWLANIKAENP